MADAPRRLKGYENFNWGANNLISTKRSSASRRSAAAKKIQRAYRNRQTRKEAKRQQRINLMAKKVAAKKIQKTFRARNRAATSTYRTKLAKRHAAITELQRAFRRRMSMPVVNEHGWEYPSYREFKKHEPGLTRSKTVKKPGKTTQIHGLPLMLGPTNKKHSQIFVKGEGAGKGWVNAYDVEGEYGGPYLTKEELRANPHYASLKAEVQGWKHDLAKSQAREIELTRAREEAERAARLAAAGPMTGDEAKMISGIIAEQARQAALEELKPRTDLTKKAKVAEAQEVYTETQQFVMDAIKGYPRRLAEEVLANMGLSTQLSAAQLARKAKKAASSTVSGALEE